MGGVRLIPLLGCQPMASRSSNGGVGVSLVVIMFVRNCLFIL